MKINDYVKIKNSSIYGRIVQIDGDKVTLEDYDEQFPMNKLKVIPPKIITKNDLRNYFRMNSFYFWEIDAVELKDNFICEDTFLPDKEDLLAMLMNMKIKDITVCDYHTWVIDINFTFGDYILPHGPCSENELDKILDKTDGDLFCHVLNVIHQCVEDEPGSKLIKEHVKLDKLINLIHLHIKNEKSGIIEYDDSEKEDYISYVDDNDILKELSVEQKQLYKNFVLELCQKDDKFGLEAYAYGCYGGNDVFECDWKKAKNILEKLYNKYGAATYANSLGYIYYYGRANNGVAQYDEAFKYFSIGVAAGIYESGYHQADMFYYGRGVTENKAQAISLYFNLYEECKRIFCEEFFDCKFADIALRLGTVFMSKAEPDYQIAHYYLLQAEYAIKKRREIADFYGDDKVEEKINNAIGNCRKMFPDNHEKKISYYEPALLNDIFDGNQRVHVHLKKLKNNKLKMEFTLLSNMSTESRKYLFTFPYFDKCILTDKFVMYAEKVDDCPDDGDYFITEYQTKKEQTTFYYFGMRAFDITCLQYTIRDVG